MRERKWMRTKVALYMEATVTPTRHRLNEVFSHLKRAFTGFAPHFLSSMERDFHATLYSIHFGREMPEQVLTV